MATFRIKFKTLVRLQKVLRHFHATTNEETKRELNTVRLENKNGKAFAIVSNHKIGVVEFLGETDQLDSVCHLKVMEWPEEGTATITVIPEALIGMMTSDIGFNVTEVCQWFDKCILERWPEWAAKDAKSSKGFMVFDLYTVKTLFESSPSGNVIFPEFIDTTRPVTLRDRESENWAAFFVPTIDMKEKPLKAAKVPDWWN